MLVFQSDIDEVMDKNMVLSTAALQLLLALHQKKGFIDSRAKEINELGGLEKDVLGIDITIEQIVEAGTVRLTCKVTTATGILASIAIGAVAVTTVFGTALTSSIASGLSGGAAITHALATLGGGSIASGGLGMVGGLATLGVVGISAAAVVGIGLSVFNFKVNNANLAKAILANAQLEAIIDKLETANALLNNIQYRLK